MDSGTWTLPGLTLLFAFGLGSVATATGLLLLIAEHSFLETIDGAVGAILVITAVLPRTRSYLRDKAGASA